MSKNEPPDLAEHARRAYQESADRYVQRAETNLSNAHWDRPVIRSLLPPIAGKRVLDAGCAGGANTEWLLDLPDYYSTGVVEDRWSEGVVHRFWRRTMEELLGSLFQAGFLLDGYLEPTPSDDVLSQFPDENVPRTPNFVFLRAIPDPVAAEH